MGAYESIPQTDDEQQEEEEQDDDLNHNNEETRNLLEHDNDNDFIMNNDLHEQEDINEIPPSFSTPRFDPSITPSHVPRAFSLESFNDDPTITELYIICHGECHMKLKPDLVGGRCPEAALTPSGKRQARALAVFLKSQGIRFNAVYSSPLDRARATAIPVCQEMNFPEKMIETSNALQEMSQGDWEGRQQSDVYSPSVLSLKERFQPDFCAPSGETLRQVEFRIIQFLNATVGPQKSSSLSDSIPPIATRPPRQLGFPKRKSNKSRLEMVRTGGGGGDQEADDEMSPRVPPNYNMQRVQHPEILLPSAKSDNVKPAAPSLPSVSSSSSSCNKSCIGIFSHSIPIKCLVTGILGCSPIMSNKICIQDSSVTVLQHSGKIGWLIKRLNDTSHLRLM